MLLIIIDNGGWHKDYSEDPRVYYRSVRQRVKNEREGGRRENNFKGAR